jgi:autotransporter translocation and assembly factor TamB
MRLLASNKKNNIRRKKRVKFLLYTITTFIIFMIFSIYLLSTPLGFNFIVAYAKPILAKYNVVIHDGKFRGRLSDFTFPGVTVHTKATTTIVNDTHIKWNPFALLIGRLSLKNLYVSKAEVKIDTSKFDHDNKPTTFDFPLNLSSKNVTIKKALVKVDDTYLHYNNLQGKVRLYHNMLLVEKLSGKSFNDTLKFNFDHASLDIDSPYHIDAQLEYTYKNKSGLSTKTGIGHLIGDFGNSFNLYTQGLVYYKDIAAPYNIVTTIHHKKISSRINSLKLKDHIITGNINFFFSDKIYWGIKLNTADLVYNKNSKSYDYSANIHGTISPSAKNSYRLESNLCNIQSKKAKIACNLSLNFNKKSVLLNTLLLSNTNKVDSISASGSIIPKLNLSWNLLIQNLHQYNPALYGEVISEGKALGVVEKPILHSNLLANNLRYYTNKIKQLHISFTHNTQQNIHVDINNQNVSTHINLMGHWANNLSWEGTLNKFTINDQNRTWNTLTQPSISISPNHIKIDELCLLYKTEFFCTSADFKSQYDFQIKYNTNLNISHLPSLIPIVSSTSYLQSHGTYERRFGFEPKVNIYADITPGVTHFGQRSERLSQYYFPSTQQVLIKNFTSHLNLENNFLNYQIISSFNKNDYIHSYGTMNLNQGRNHLTHPIQSNIEFQIHSLNFLSSLTPFPIKILGETEGKIKLNGSLKTPSLQGNINISKLNINIIPLGATIKNANINIKATPPLKVEITSSGLIGQSTAQLHGNLQYNTGSIKGAINITGNNLNIVNIPGLNISISPDISIKKPHKNIHINGKIKVDKALVNMEILKDILPNNSIKNDIIYSGDIKAKKTKKTLPFITNISILANRNVKFVGYGLDTFLEGTLNIRNRINRIATGVGKIYFKNGTFNKYGKTFNIDKSSNLTYNNNPLTNPELSILAYYQIPPALSLSSGSPTMLGISIIGNLSTIQPRLISSPTLSQQDILAYILLGQPANNNGASNSSDLSKAALLVLLSGSSDIALNQLKNKLGLTDISVGNINDGYLLNSQLQSISSQGMQQNNTAIFVGKNITDRLFLSYGIGVFNGRQEVNALFKLDQNWNVRSNWTNIDTGADLIYTITP